MAVGRSFTRIGAIACALLIADCAASLSASDDPRRSEVGCRAPTELAEFDAFVMAYRQGANHDATPRQMPRDVQWAYERGQIIAGRVVIDRTARTNVCA